MNQKQDEENVVIIFRAAIQKMKSESYTDAIELIDDAIKEYPSYEIAWPSKALLMANKGKCLRHLRQYDEAEKILRSAIDMDQENPHIWSCLGLVYARVNKFERAAECLRNSIKLEESAPALTLLAAAEYEFDVESSIRSAKRALEIDPDWDEAKIVLRKAETLSKLD